MSSVCLGTVTIILQSQKQCGDQACHPKDGHGGSLCPWWHFEPANKQILSRLPLHLLLGEINFLFPASWVKVFLSVPRGWAGKAMQGHTKKQGWLGSRRSKEKAWAGRLIVVFHGKKWLRQGKQAKQVWDWLVWISSASSGIYDLSWAVWFLALGWLRQRITV